MKRDLPLADWTCGVDALAYQRCRACAHAWYFRRPFCPACGADRPEHLFACGRGTVYAVTTVNRAPSTDLATLAPYAIVLVDAEEGFRLMAHGVPGLRIGDAVVAGFRDFGGRRLPCFTAAVPSAHTEETRP